MSELYSRNSVGLPRLEGASNWPAPVLHIAVSNSTGDCMKSDRAVLGDACQSCRHAHNTGPDPQAKRQHRAGKGVVQTIGSEFRKAHLGQQSGPQLCLELRRRLGREVRLRCAPGGMQRDGNAVAGERGNDGCLVTDASDIGPRPSINSDVTSAARHTTGPAANAPPSRPRAGPLPLPAADPNRRANARLNDTGPSCRTKGCQRANRAAHSNIRQARSDRCKSFKNQPTRAVSSIHRSSATISSSSMWCAVSELTMMSTDCSGRYARALPVTHLIPNSLGVNCSAACAA